MFKIPISKRDEFENRLNQEIEMTLPENLKKELEDLKVHVNSKELFLGMDYNYGNNEKFFSLSVAVKNANTDKPFSQELKDFLQRKYSNLAEQFR
jgi:hypothetical protein